MKHSRSFHPSEFICWKKIQNASLLFTVAPLRSRPTAPCTEEDNEEEPGCPAAGLQEFVLLTCTALFGDELFRGGVTFHLPIGYRQDAVGDIFNPPCILQGWWSCATNPSCAPSVEATAFLFLQYLNTFVVNFYQLVNVETWQIIIKSGCSLKANSCMQKSAVFYFLKVP